MRTLALALALGAAAGWAAAAGEAPVEAAAPPLDAQPATDSVQLPANPVDVAAGDVDGDGTAEIVLLLLYPAWGSAAEVRDTREGQEVDVVAALQDRRELRAYEVEGGTRLRLAAAPLPLDGSVFALDALPRGGPVVAMTAAGPARVVVSAGAADPRRGHRAAGARPGGRRTARVRRRRAFLLVRAPARRSRRRRAA